MAEHTSALSSNEYMERELHSRLSALEASLKTDALVLIGPIADPIDSIVRYAIERREKKTEALSVFLETDGGLIEIAERLANTFRHHYDVVDFFIPNFAMSAGTVLVMCGDSIAMDYFSILGPIDPQLSRMTSEGPVPALGYLAKYQELVAKSKAGKLTSAELAYLIEKFDPAELHAYEQAKNLSIELLQEWLVEYKFKNWEKTETRGRPVTLKMKLDRAKQIANKLNDTRRWKSHGRGLCMDVLVKDLNLKIRDFGQDAELNGLIQSYYRLLTDYMGRRGQAFTIHTPGEYLAFSAPA